MDLYADLPGVDTLPADTLPDDLPGPDSPTFDLSPPNFDVTGSWSGTYNGALVGSGSLTATLVQTGGQVTGSISMLVISNAPFKGTVSGNQFMGSGTASLGSASFKMTIATGGNSMSGTFTGTALGSTDSGTVSLTRIIPEAGPVDVGLADMVGPAEAGGAD